METITQPYPATSAELAGDDPLLSTGMDYYKMTMSQLAYEQEPNVDVTFTFKNRGTQRLMDYVSPEGLQKHFDSLQSQGWTAPELKYLGGLTMSDDEPVFSEGYLNHIGGSEMPPVTVAYNEDIDDITMSAKGDLSMATFWETVVMSEANEQYFENYLQAWDINPETVYDEGDRRLDRKIGILQNNPGIKIVDFGTRRHFSAKWQEHVVGRLAEECPDNLVGTSNVALAQKFGIKPIGTFAHEMPMVYAGLADARTGGDPVAIEKSHGRFLDDWYRQYGEDYSTALTDTFTTDFFFSDFTHQQAEVWRGVRHDSGDPIEFGEKLIAFYEQQDIDPAAKTAVFSDGLDMDTIVKLYQHFEGRINMAFGWGTTLTNDMGCGLKPLNIVMKATHVRDRLTGAEADTVKLSDNAGKHTGPQQKVDQYQTIFAA